MPSMSRDEADAFLRETRIAKLATLHEDGAPSVVPVWYEWDGERARVFSSKTAGKTTRIRDDPRVSLTVEEPAGVPEKWVSIEGTAEIRDEGALELATRLANRYYAEPRRGEAIEEWTGIAQHLCVIEITAKRILSSA
jgi:PPOX class probable F420-dependent enzyme